MHTAVYEELLAVPVVKGKKTENEKFGRCAFLRLHSVSDIAALLYESNFKANSKLS